MDIRWRVRAPGQGDRLLKMAPAVIIRLVIRADVVAKLGVPMPVAVAAQGQLEVSVKALGIRRGSRIDLHVHVD